METLEAYMNYSADHLFGSRQKDFALTPAQRLAAFEGAEAKKRHRRRATAKIFGIAVMIFISCVLFSCGYAAFVLGALVLGVVAATAAVWGVFDNFAQTSKAPSSSLSEREMNAIEDISNRLANLETILSYEEKIAARNLRAEVASE